MAIVKRLTTSTFTFKKLAMGAAIAGLIAVPSFVAAESSTGASTNTSTTGTTSTATDPTSTSTTGTVTTSTGTTVPTTTNTNTSTSVTFQQAVDTAQTTFASKTIVKAVLLDAQSNTPYYMVVFSDGSRVIVDGTSGSVVFSFDTATQTATGTNPLSEKDDAGTDEDSQGDMHFGGAHLHMPSMSNARGSQGEERRND
ncbi:MAG TPA: hypothetical protein VFN56_01565 [Candidatus Saccharimonadales bacterium]|nr:hypothetical protein [Candidatus Saccharimonadales bacterium]